MSAASRIHAALRSDAVGGSLLIGAALAALVWANSSAADSYEALRSFSFGPAALHLHLPVQEWAADGLLAVFFFIVGNELKQEVVHGELRDPRRAVLPIAAAIGGVALPALVFLAITAGSPDAATSGWGVPMATDIAFAVAVLAVVGRHIPGPARTFLLTLATVDDMAAVVVIAVAYTASLNLLALAVAGSGLILFGYLQNARNRAITRLHASIPGWLLFTPLAVVIWAATHASGIHATVAAVAMGLLMRTRTRDHEAVSPSHRAEESLRPVSAGFALPVFALMSAGVSLSDGEGFWEDTITWGIAAGLVVGKFVGIFGTAWITARLTAAHLNPKIAWPDIAGIAALGGIGFTVSLLIAELSYTDATQLASAKGAILLASVSASILGAAVLGARSRRYRLRERLGRRLSRLARSI